VKKSDQSRLYRQRQQQDRDMLVTGCYLKDLKKGDRVVATVRDDKYFPPIGALGTVVKNCYCMSSPEVEWDEPHTFRPRCDGIQGLGHRRSGWDIVTEGDIDLILIEDILETAPKTTLEKLHQKTTPETTSSEIRENTPVPVETYPVKRVIETAPVRTTHPVKRLIETE
jgi:hypothetical protein